jgi:hypothetical protein
MNPQSFFLSECLSHVRSMPLQDAVRFLNGLLLSCGDTPVTNEIRKVYINLDSSDRQLELIQSSQLKLDFTPNVSNDGNGHSK